MNHLREVLDSWNSATPGLVEDPIRTKEFFKEIGSRAMCFYCGDFDQMLTLSAIDELSKLPYDTCWFEFNIDCRNTRPDFPIGVLAMRTHGVHVLYLFNKSAGVWAFHAKLLSKDVTLGSNSAWATVPKLPDNSNMRVLICAIACFLSAMNCTNVKRKEHIPDAPLQKARAKRGKLPLFSYWTLELTGERTERGDHQGGTHAGPRVHLRRGHPRQYAPGKYTWVQAHAVGHKHLGMIHKDYELR